MGSVFAKLERAIPRSMAFRVARLRISDLDQYALACAWARYIDPDATVHWSDVAVQVAGVHSGYVDIVLADLKCYLTVEGEGEVDDDFDDHDPTTIVLEYEFDLWAVHENHSPIERAAVVVAPGVELSREHSEALEAVVAERPDDRELRCHGAWSPSTISGALEEWVRVHAGRDDVTFVYDHASLATLRRRNESQWNVLRRGWEHARRRIGR